MFLISDTRGVDQWRFRVLDVDAKGNLYLYKTALLCKNEIIKRLTYSLAEQTKLSMRFLFYFLKHRYKLIKKSEIDLNTSVLFTSCPCISRFMPFNVILSWLGISKCVYLCYVLSPKNKTLFLSAPSTRFKFLGLLFHIPLLSVKNQIFLYNWVLNCKRPSTNLWSNKIIGLELYFWEK